MQTYTQTEIEAAGVLMLRALVGGSTVQGVLDRDKEIFSQFLAKPELVRELSDRVYRQLRAQS